MGLGNITVDEGAMKELLSGVILQHLLTPEKRDALIKDALGQLLLPQDGGRYSDKRSPLELAFREAALSVARKQVTEALEKDEAFKKAVEALFQDAWKKVMENGEARTKIVDRVASAIGDVLSGERSRY